VDSGFLAFSTEGSETVSLPSIGKTDGPFSEQMFNIKTILGQLVRISTALRRSGTKYRYRKADASLKEKDFEDFKEHLTFVVIFGFWIPPNAEEPANAPTKSFSISEPGLTAVQKRLIYANIVRRNRIEFATRSMKPVAKPATQQVQQQPINIAKIPAPKAEPTTCLPSGPVEPAEPPQALSIVAQSTTQTATEIDPQFNWQAAEPKKTTPSVMTRVTQIGTTQDYPSCPDPISDELLQCPYCADSLPVDYSKHQSRWRYEIQIEHLGATL
jgi:hypothetical protein